MKVLKLLFMIAITMAITITFTMKNTNNEELKPPFKSIEVLKMPSSLKRVSRFLAEEKNPRAADHCKKDNEICILDGNNSTCCNKKCMDLKTDKNNCGKCKHKCEYTDFCCRGECVNLSYDKRNCGSCGKRCMPGGYCIYGMCNYA